MTILPITTLKELLYTQKELANSLNMKSRLFLGMFLFFILGAFFTLIFKVIQINIRSITLDHVQTFSQNNSQLPKIPTFTMNEIFSSNHDWTNELPNSDTVRLIATGDVIPARMVNFTTTSQDDFTWPYRNTADFLNSADITFINLETPLLTNCPIYTTGFTFCGEDKNIQGLKFAGVDVASLANNHAGNFGLNGVEQTQQLLEKNNILATGVDRPVYKTTKGIKFAFLGFNDIGGKQSGIDYADNNNVSAQIAEAKKQADIVVVMFHWGIEYQTQPSRRQIELGHLAIDSGADLVIGNHPHWIEPIEFYKGKLIAYAQGNFVFDQDWSQKTQEGVLGKYTFYKRKLVDVQYFPIRILGYGQPYFYQGIDKQRILNDLKNQSEMLANSSALTD